MRPATTPQLSVDRLTVEASSELFQIGRLPIVRHFESESGVSFGLGAGHEWRLGSRFALGATLDYHTFSVDSGDFDFLNVTAQLNWYF